MLLLASLAVCGHDSAGGATCPTLHGGWVLAPAVLLLIDPLFYMQSMMAQLDMPAMLFTRAGAVAVFQDRHKSAAFASTALVLTKETGAILPRFSASRCCCRSAAQEIRRLLSAAPFFALASWFLVLWRTTGQLFGDAGFTHYNLVYSLNPVRATLTLIRRRLLSVLRRTCGGWDARHLSRPGASRLMFLTRPWKITGYFSPRHRATWSACWEARNWSAICFPCSPLLYIAMVAAFFAFEARWRIAGVAAVGAGLLAGCSINPPFPVPYENNLAMVDFVQLQRAAARFIEQDIRADHLHRLAAYAGAPRSGFTAM